MLCGKIPISLPYQKSNCILLNLLYCSVTMLKMTPETSKNMDFLLNFYVFMFWKTAYNMDNFSNVLGTALYCNFMLGSLQLMRLVLKWPKGPDQPRRSMSQHDMPKLKQVSSNLAVAGWGGGWWWVRGWQWGGGGGWAVQFQYCAVLYSTVHHQYQDVCSPRSESA